MSTKQLACHIQQSICVQQTYVLRTRAASKYCAYKKRSLPVSYLHTEVESFSSRHAKWALKWLSHSCSASDNFLKCQQNNWLVTFSKVYEYNRPTFYALELLQNTMLTKKSSILLSKLCTLLGSQSEWPKDKPFKQKWLCDSCSASDNCLKCQRNNWLVTFSKVYVYNRPTFYALELLQNTMFTKNVLYQFLICTRR